MKITIYYNSKCSKSRQTLAILEEKGIIPTIINYLENVLTFLELKELINLLDIKPIELVRTKEETWKEEFKNKNLSDGEIIQIMVDHPILIERPIVVNNNQEALICRPPKLVLKLI
jgi:arsenate reductase